MQRTKEEVDELLSGMKESILGFNLPYDPELIPENFEGTAVFTDRTVTVTLEPDEDAKN